MDLQAARAKRWWHTARPIRSLQRAAAFVDHVGFALLFPTRDVPLPSLYNAATERAAGTAWDIEWGPDAERIWGWKDELPRRGLAWYGKLVYGKGSFVSPSLLADLYPRSGRPDDFTEASLSEDARRIAEMLLLSGPTSTGTLREALGMEGKKRQSRFSTAVAELGRQLVVTNYGVEDRGGGWPAAVLELTARAFEVPGRGPLERRRLRATETFVRTMIEADPTQLSKTFAWPLAQARRYLESAKARPQPSSTGDSPS